MNTYEVQQKNKNKFIIKKLYNKIAEKIKKDFSSQNVVLKELRGHF